MTLGILLPSRGRPDNLKRFIESTFETAHNARIYIRLDEDDPALEAYQMVLDTLDGEEWATRGVVGPRTGFASSMNELAELAESDGMSHVGMFGDDVEPITPGWDLALTTALGGRLGVAYGDDGLRKKHAPDLPTHYVTQIEVYRRLGYLAPPTIRHLFLDNVARDIGRVLKNFQYVPVLLKHHHPWAEGEHLHDSTYAEGGRNSDLRLQDQRAYIQWQKQKDWRKRLTE